MASRKSRAWLPIPRPAQRFSTAPSPSSTDRIRFFTYETSGLAVGREQARGLELGQIEGVKIGAPAQHGLVGILSNHRIGSGIDDLIDDRGRSLIEKRLTRDNRGLLIVAHTNARD